MTAPFDPEKWKHWSTVYTDASVRAGRAYVGVRCVWGTLDMVVPPLRVEDAQACPDELVRPDAFAAEVYGMLFGVLTAVANWHDKGMTACGLRCDSLGAVDLINRWAQARARHGRATHPRRRDVNAILAHFDRTLPRTVHVRARWVRGHQGTETIQGWMNERVDALARIQ